MAYNTKTRRHCPECKAEAFVDTWSPADGYDPYMRKFVCSDCGLEFYIVVKDPELRKAYDKLLCRM